MSKRIFVSWYDINEENEYIKVGKYFKSIEEFYKWCEENDYCDDEFFIESADSE